MAGAGSVINCGVVSLFSSEKEKVDSEPHDADEESAADGDSARFLTRDVSSRADGFVSLTVFWAFVEAISDSRISGFRNIDI